MQTKLTTKEMTVVGLGVALMGAFSQLAIPLPTVPLTLQIFGAILLAIVLESKLATLVMIIYTLVGAIGVPVFANFSRGISVIIGPTGGYITGFIVLAFIIGKAAEQKNQKVLFVGAYVALFMQYAIGTLQLKGVLGVSFSEAMVAGVYPFIVKDLVLTSIAVVVALQIKKQIRGILNGNIKA
ncbi:MAG: biotin transporter BioY [Niameybacter sp.]|uniref:biotin transporter BioY n=1 Tax=Niameybacter sp. TaxID=2033640 RepID=UPI002FC8C5B5